MTQWNLALRSLLAALALALLGDAPAQAQLTVSGATGFVRQAETGDYGGIHSVAIVTAIGGRITLFHQNFLDHDAKPLDIKAWDIDELTAATIKAYLGARFTYKDVPYDRGALAALPPGDLRDKASLLRSALTALPAEGIDAFIVVHDSNDGPGIAGIAMDNGGSTAIRQPELFANYTLDIVDAHTLKVIGHASSRVQVRQNMEPSFAILALSPRLQLGEDLSLRDSQLPELRTNLERLVRRSLLETIRSLAFGVTLPPIGAHALEPYPPGEAPFPNIKTIAVLSLIGDTLDMHYSDGLLPQSLYAPPILSWNLDSDIEKMVGATLSKRFTFKPLVVDRTKLMRVLVTTKEGLNPDLLPVLGDPKVDAYILVFKVPQDIVHSQSFTAGRGAGMLHQVRWIGPSPTVVFANYALVLYDGHTLKPITGLRGYASPSQASITPKRDVAPETWPDKPPALSDAQAATIRQTLMEEFADSVPETMLYLGLTDVRMQGGPPVSALP